MKLSFDSVIQKALPALLSALVMAAVSMYTDIQLLKRQVELNSQLGPLVRQLDKRLAVTNERLAGFTEYLAKGRAKNGKRERDSDRGA